MIVDTSALIAYFVETEPHHKLLLRAINEHRGPLIVSPLVLAEVDYLMASRLGVRAELVVMRELAGGAWELPHLDTQLITKALDIVERYGDLRIGLTDASLIVLAERYRTKTIATLDRRHFSVLRLRDGAPPVLVP